MSDITRIARSLNLPDASEPEEKITNDDANPSPLTAGVGGISDQVQAETLNTFDSILTAEPSEGAGINAVTDQISSVALNPQPLPPVPDPDPPFNPITDPFSSVALNPQPLPPVPPDPDPPYDSENAVPFGDALLRKIFSEPHLSGLTETMDFKGDNFGIADTPQAVLSEELNPNFAPEKKAYMEAPIGIAKAEAIRTPESEAISKMISTFKSYFQPLVAYKERFDAFMKAIYSIPYKTPSFEPSGEERDLHYELHDYFSEEKAEALRQRALAGDYTWLPKVQFVPGSAVTNSWGETSGGYSPKPSGTVYLNDALLKDPERAADSYIRAVGYQLGILTSDPPSVSGTASFPPEQRAEAFRRDLTGKPPVSQLNPWGTTLNLDGHYENLIGV